jgi:hypothetical protein
LRRLRITNEAGSVVPAVALGGDAVFEVTVESAETIHSFRLLMEVTGARGERLMTLSNHVQHGRNIDFQGRIVLRARLKNCRLVPGHYRLRLIAKSRWKKLDEVAEGLTFEVSATDAYGTGRLPKGKHGCILPEVEWTVDAP